MASVELEWARRTQFAAESEPTEEDPEELIREALWEVGQAQQGLLEMLAAVRQCGEKVEPEAGTRNKRLVAFQSRRSR